MQVAEVKWIDAGHAVRDGDGFLIYSQSGECQTISRVSVHTFRRYIEGGKRLLEEFDREQRVVEFPGNDTS